MTAQWLAVILASVGCYALKYVGLAVPERWLERPALRRLLDLLPAALLAALVVVQTFAVSAALTLDLRAVGLSAGAVALLLKAPFPVVLLSAGAAAAAASLLLP